MAHGCLCKDLRAAHLGQRQVIHVHRVFGANVATRHAVATVDALPPHHALAVTREQRAFLIEKDFAGRRPPLQFAADTAAATTKDDARNGRVISIASRGYEL
jgi:hypothetical protein